MENNLTYLEEEFLAEGAVDLFIVYQFIKRLATPFDEWDAYETGVIDEKGNIIVDKRKRTPEQKKSFEVFDNMIRKLKRLLEKVPGGKQKVASYAAALWLIKEGVDFLEFEEVLNEEDDMASCKSLLAFIMEHEERLTKSLVREVRRNREKFKVGDRVLINNAKKKKREWATLTKDVHGDGKKFETNVGTVFFPGSEYDYQPVKEDAVAAAPTSSAGGGHIDGIGVGPRGEPGVKKKKKKKPIFMRKK